METELIISGARAAGSTLAIDVARRQVPFLLIDVVAVVVAVLGMVLGAATPAAADGGVPGADVQVAQTLGDRELTVIIRRVDAPPAPLRVDVVTHAGTSAGRLELHASTAGETVSATMLFEKHLAPAGIGMVSLDNAGFGDSKDWPADRPDMDRLYSAVIDTLRTDQRIDAKRIGAMGQSYGGNTVGRLAFTDERVKAVVSVCGPVHQALNSGTAFIDNLPPQPRAALAARFDVPVEDTERMAQLVKKASLINQGFVDNMRTDTPILALTNADDPFAPVEDLERLAASSTDGEVKIIAGHGHCPLIKDRNPPVADWFERKL